jgi:hypothetical protein
MAKAAISLTLAEENLLWLKGLALRRGHSMSAVIDSLVSQARTGRHASIEQPRSVVGTLDLMPADPTLSGADEAIRDLFSASLARPMMVREQSPQYDARRPRR